MMPSPKIFAPTSLLGALFVFLIIAPVVLAAVFAVVTTFAPRPFPEAAFWIPFMWWVSIFTHPETWRLTIIPTATAAVLLWAALGLVRARCPWATSTRLRMIITSTIFAAVLSLVSWELVNLSFDGASLPQWGLSIVLAVVVPTGAFLGAFLGLISELAP
jgi:hypothetical protein